MRRALKLKPLKILRDALKLFIFICPIFIAACDNYEDKFNINRVKNTDYNYRLSNHRTDLQILENADNTQEPINLIINDILISDNANWISISASEGAIYLYNFNTHLFYRFLISNDQDFRSLYSLTHTSFSPDSSHFLVSYTAHSSAIYGTNIFIVDLEDNSVRAFSRDGQAIESPTLLAENRVLFLAASNEGEMVEQYALRLPNPSFSQPGAYRTKIFDLNTGVEACAFLDRTGECETLGWLGTASIKQARNRLVVRSPNIIVDSEYLDAPVSTYRSNTGYFIVDADAIGCPGHLDIEFISPRFPYIGHDSDGDLYFGRSSVIDSIGLHEQWLEDVWRRLSYAGERPHQGDVDLRLFGEVSVFWAAPRLTDNREHLPIVLCNNAHQRCNEEIIHFSEAVTVVLDQVKTVNFE